MDFPTLLCWRMWASCTPEDLLRIHLETMRVRRMESVGDADQCGVCMHIPRMGFIFVYFFKKDHSVNSQEVISPICARGNRESGRAPFAECL